MRKINKKRVLILFCLSLALVLPLNISAVDGRRVSVYLDGREVYQEKPYLVSGVTYVPLRDYLEKNTDLTVSWNGSTRTAHAQADGISISASSRDSYILANGRYLYYSKNINRNGVMYVPLRTLMSALGGNVKWVSGAMTANAYSGARYITHGDDYYDQSDLYWLSRIISAESRGQPFDGMLAVGSVVMNRRDSTLYPDSIYDVIFDTRFGVQFTPISNGSIYDEPTEESIIAAKICLEGYRVDRSILYFINESLADSKWVSENCKYVVSIGDHDFYA